MSWVAITEADILTHISGAELSALRAAALADGQADPVQPSIDQVTAQVRGYVAGCSSNTLDSDTTTIPDRLLASACDMVIVAIIGRIPGYELDDKREDNYDKAIRLMEQVASCKFAVTDPETGARVKVHDLSQGKYDVTVSIGPNFATKRQEAADLYGAMLERSPELFKVAGDLLFKALDMPYADEIAERLQALLPPEIQAMMKQGADGGEMPPEVTAAMEQVEQGMMMVEAGMDVGVRFKCGERDAKRTVTLIQKGKSLVNQR